MKTIKKIAFNEIESIPVLVKDFLNQKIKGFEDHIFTIENVQKQIELKGNSYSKASRDVLIAEIKNQLSSLDLSETQKVNIDLLASTNTFTITTGHQLNLFSGPAFFIYKILQTIKTCQFLKEKLPEFDFVPVYWMASEDHDFEEINHFKTETNYYEINENSGGPVGKINIKDTYFITEFENEFKDHVFGTELILMLKEAYKKGNSLTEAIKILVQRLFSNYGLLMLDGDSSVLKSQMKEVFKNEILGNELKEHSAEKVQYFTDRYGKVQVNPRDINLFYLSSTRDRIERENNLYKIVDKEIRFSEKEIIEEIQRHPEKFSPNALMRPVYQEIVLPNVAYIGGNAEIMYWLELKDYFVNLQLAFPILVPRNSMLFLKEKHLKKIDKLSLSLEDFFNNFTAIANSKILKDSPILQEIESAEALLQKQFSSLLAAARHTEHSFGNLVRAEEKRQIKSFARMKKRLLRAEKIKQTELLQRLESIFLEVNPSKNWQERVYNYSVFFADHGTSWIEFCMQEMVVEDSKLIIVAI